MYVCMYMYILCNDFEHFKKSLLQRNPIKIQEYKCLYFVTKMLFFDFYCSSVFFKIIICEIKIVLKKLENIELIVLDTLRLLNNIIGVLTKISNNDRLNYMNNHVESSIQFACKLVIDPNYNFNL